MKHIVWALLLLAGCEPSVKNRSDDYVACLVDIYTWHRYLKWLLKKHKGSRKHQLITQSQNHPRQNAMDGADS